MSKIPVAYRLIGTTTLKKGDLPDYFVSRPGKGEIIEDLQGGRWEIKEIVHSMIYHSSKKGPPVNGLMIEIGTVTGGSTAGQGGGTQDIVGVV